MDKYRVTVQNFLRLVAAAAWLACTAMFVFMWVTGEVEGGFGLVLFMSGVAAPLNIAIFYGFASFILCGSSDGVEAARLRLAEKEEYVNPVRTKEQEIHYKTVTEPKLDMLNANTPNSETSAEEEFAWIVEAIGCMREYDPDGWEKHIGANMGNIMREASTEMGDEEWDLFFGYILDEEAILKSTSDEHNVELDSLAKTQIISMMKQELKAGFAGHVTGNFDTRLGFAINACRKRNPKTIH